MIAATRLTFDKGALAAPFVFVGLALAAVGSLVASPSLWLGALTALFAVRACRPDGRTPGLTAIAAAVAAYAGWSIGNDLFNTAYTAAGIFHPMFLVGGFLFARRCNQSDRKQAFVLFVAGAALLATWGIAQAAVGEGRAHAFFETPNTLATVLNLALAPLAIAMSLGERRRVAVVVACLLAAGLTTTLSRGGFLALASALAIVWIFFRRPAMSCAPRRVLACVVAGAAIGLIALAVPTWLMAAAPSAFVDFSLTLPSTVGSRSELYRLALAGAGEHPWAGIGYLGFYDFFQMHRAQVPSYGVERITYFAHNDYLQTLLELGLPALAFLCALIALPFLLALRRSQNAAPRPAVVAALAALATMAVHALGDFPFYVPLCLLLFGAALGVVDRELAATVDERSLGRGGRMASTAAAVVLATLLALPPAAEAAAAYADRKWQSGDAVPAAFAFELARRLQPRDWRYPWFAGQFWLAQAENGNAAAAPLADRAFAASIEANPREPRPLLGRLATQLRFSAFLPQPQPSRTLRAWADRALSLAPLNPAVRQDSTAALELLSHPR